MNFTELMISLASGACAIVRTSAHQFNLTYSQAIQILNIPFDGIPMSKLAKQIGLDNSTMTRNVQKLSALDLVSQAKGGYDSRVVIVSLTKKGYGLVGLLESQLHDMFSEILDGIDLDTQEHAITVLEQLTWSMDCYREKI